MLKNTIHLGFYYVVEEYRGLGLGYELLKNALEQFKENGFDGISLRVSLNNLPSLSVIKKFRFEVISEYFDNSLGERRCYGIIY